MVAAWPGSAAAQLWIGSGAPRAGSVEITGGIVSLAGFDMGSRSAEQTRNVTTGAPGASDPFALFAARSRLASAPGAQLGIGVYLSPSISIDTGVQYGRLSLSSMVSGDAEQASDLTADESITRYVFVGSLVLHLPRLSFAAGRGVPFVSGGGGYLRELHERNEFVETGREYHATAGVKLWFGTGRRRFGVRADVGASLRNGGIDFQSGRRTVPTGGVAVSYLF